MNSITNSYQDIVDYEYLTKTSVMGGVLTKLAHNSNPVVILILNVLYSLLISM